MLSIPRFVRLLPALAVLLFAWSAHAQSFRVQCPTSTAQHPGGTNPDGSKIKCQQISGGDGYATMGDGTQTYLFGFGPLSGLADIYNGLPGTEAPDVFNMTLGDWDTSAANPAHPTTFYSDFLTGVGPSPLIGMPNAGFNFNGAIGLAPDPTAEQVGSVATVINTLTDTGIGGTGYAVGEPVVLTGGGFTTQATAQVSAVDGAGGIVSITVTNPGDGYSQAPIATVTTAHGTGAQLVATLQVTPNSITGHVDPRMIMDVGVMNANQPAPLIAIDEDDELFLTLTNVGMIMRPDLFEQHTVHFHGYPNASSFYDGVPDASVAINIGASFSYYYLAPDAGTYFWHCHISPPEHLQMGMVGQLYVRPRQNRVSVANSLRTALTAYEGPANVSLLNDPSASAAAKTAEYERLRKSCNGDILCTSPIPPTNGATGGGMYAYNDGDGSTRYDVEYPIQIHGFDPNFHFVGMTFNPESFTDMKDKYFLLNGRSYPDTVSPGPMQTQSTDGTLHHSQPLPTIINIPAGGRALLRISDLDVTEYDTLASLGVPMTVIALNARLLRDLDGNNMAYKTNSITLGGGESLDVILDASDTTTYSPGQKFYLYSPNMDHLSNDAENFGGMMTEVNICKSVDPTTKACSL